MTVHIASVTGLLLSFVVLFLLRPAVSPPWCWNGRGLLLHIGLWGVLHATLILVLGRPWFAMVLALAFLMLIVQVSNAKYLSLKEPFVFQDFEYFTDAIKHPRLYIPFLGWGKFFAIAVVVLLALLVGLLMETAPPGRFLPGAQLGDVLWVLLPAVFLLFALRNGPAPCFLPLEDINCSGLLAALWDYAWAERIPLAIPASGEMLGQHPVSADFVVVQSESFFDPRLLFSGIRSDVLKSFDALQRDACMYGKLDVPAWGANTVRSEFAFLSGIDPEMLGVHRFNPYRRLLSGKVNSLALLLRSAGYRTVCVHPYPATFYNRKNVFPVLGFDEFIDIQDFPNAKRTGPYVADAEIVGIVEEILAKAESPVFVFVITMENHGPLHLESPCPGDIPALFDTPPPEGCDDLIVYLRHLVNADQMAGRLRELLTQRERESFLCWYGDHVPIMADVYKTLGMPSGKTDYFIWGNRRLPGKPHDLSLHELAACLIRTADAVER